MFEGRGQGSKFKVTGGKIC